MWLPLWCRPDQRILKVQTGAEITVQLGRKDLNEMKRLRNTAISGSTTGLVFDDKYSAMIKDMHNNNVRLWPEYLHSHHIETTDGVKRYNVATSFTPDRTRPELLNYDIDLDKGLLYLDFDETIRYDTFEGAAKLSLLNQKSGSGSNVTLTSKSTLVAVANVDSSMLTIKLDTIDQWRVKNDANLLTSLSNGYLQMLASAVHDMNDNAMEVNTASVRTILADTTAPKLVWYGVDLISGQITMSFDEPVNPATLRLGASTFQSGAGETAKQASKLLLSVGEVTKVSSGKTYDTGTRLVAELEDKDLTTLQQDMALLTGTVDTYYTFTNKLLKDMADYTTPNTVAAISPVAARKATKYHYYDYAKVTSVGPDAGNPDGGSRITIRGTGFKQEANRKGSRFLGDLPVDVYINGVPADKVTVLSDTVLECTTPAVASKAQTDTKLPVLVKVDKALETTYMGFTYMKQPVLKSVNPIAGAISGSTRVTLYGDNFGEDTSTGRGAYIKATFGGKFATNCIVENGAAVCDSPAGQAVSTIDVIIDVDGARSSLADAFTYLAVPTVSSVSPPSGYYLEDTPITIYGAHYGPLNSTGLGPRVRVYVGSRECYNAAVTTSTSSGEAITCVVPKGLGVDELVVDVDGTNSTQQGGFTTFNDAGHFEFEKPRFDVRENETSVTIKIKRSKSASAPPTDVTVTAADGTATSPDYFKAGTQTVSFNANQFEATFTVIITASARVTNAPSQGAYDDTYVLLTIDATKPLHGKATNGASSQLFILAACAAINDSCAAGLNKDGIQFQAVGDFGRLPLGMSMGPWSTQSYLTAYGEGEPIAWPL